MVLRRLIKLIHEKRKRGRQRELKRDTNRTDHICGRVNSTAIRSRHSLIISSAKYKGETGSGAQANIFIVNVRF